MRASATGGARRRCRFKPVGSATHRMGKAQRARLPRPAMGTARRPLPMLRTCAVRVTLESGGESGIRTHGRLLTYTRFPGVHLRPLGHLSGGRGRSIHAARYLDNPSTILHSPGPRERTISHRCCLHEALRHGQSLIVRNAHNTLDPCGDGRISQCFPISRCLQRVSLVQVTARRRCQCEHLPPSTDKLRCNSNVVWLPTHEQVHAVPECPWGSPLSEAGVVVRQTSPVADPAVAGVSAALTWPSLSLMGYGKLACRR